MITKTLSVGAAALMLALPAFAQTSSSPPASQQQQPTQTQQQQQQQPMQTQQQRPAQTQQMPGGTSTQAIQFIDRQQRNQWLASRFMDRTVYNLEGESIGDVNDVLVGQDGRVMAVVIGVGGFLGIGEKNVAVPFDRFELRPAGDRTAANNRGTANQPAPNTTTTTTQAPSTTTGGGVTAMGDSDMWSDRNARLVLRTTREDLRNAPRFEEWDDRGTARTNTDNNTNRTPANPSTPSTPAR